MAFPTTTQAAHMPKPSRSRTVPAQTERPVHADADDGVRCRRVSVTPLWRRQVPSDFPPVLFERRISRCPAARVLTAALRDDGKYARGSTPWAGGAWRGPERGNAAEAGGGGMTGNGCPFSRNSPRRFPVRAEGVRPPRGQHRWLRTGNIFASQKQTA